MNAEPETIFLLTRIKTLRRLIVAINREIAALETRIEDIRRGGCQICHWTEGHDPRCALAGKEDQ